MYFHSSLGYKKEEKTQMKKNYIPLIHQYRNMVEWLLTKRGKDLRSNFTYFLHCLR